MNGWLWAVLIVEVVILILAGAVTGRTIDFTFRDWIGGWIGCAIIWVCAFIGAGAAAWFLVAPGILIGLWDVRKIGGEFTYTYPRWATVTVITAVGFTLMVANS